MIIDTHVHFADPATPNPDLFRLAMPDVLKHIAAPQGVTGVVVVEARQSIEENEWMLDLAAHEPFIVGYVGSIDPYSPGFADHLERFATNPLFRGIRVHTLEHSGVDAERVFMENMERLAEADMALDLHLSHEQLGPVHDIARHVPNLRLVLNHIAEGRLIATPPDAEWVENITRAARHPQAFIKISALVQMTYREPSHPSPEFARRRDVPAPSEPEYYRATIDAVWNAFGEDRVIYASNWPQIERVSDYATALDIVRSYFERKGSETVDRFFWKNARAAYKWVERPGTIGDHVPD